MTKFVAWYRGPRQHDAVNYIREYPAGNFFQESWPAGRESVSNIADATRYDTYEEARAVVPVYDGSGGIEDRAGVIEVLAPGEAPPRDPWNLPVLVFAVLVAVYFFWQFFIR